MQMEWNWTARNAICLRMIEFKWSVRNDVAETGILQMLLIHLGYFVMSNAVDSKKKTTVSHTLCNKLNIYMEFPGCFLCTTYYMNAYCLFFSNLTLKNSEFQIFGLVFGMTLISSK